MANLDNNQDKSRHGGKRSGAGRKAGAATKKTRLIAEKAMAEGITPLEFMLDIMRTEPGDIEDARLLADHQAMRFEAAKAAAPYIHPRLAAVEHTAPDGIDLRVTKVERVIVDTKD
jgi:hypothetical protein